jgi:DNA-binding CsgD family transcriptional regulator/N-acetylneuraminic acid mutarotase
MTNDPPSISEREREILQLVATGATNQQIAYQLNISTNTVRVHLRNIFGKLGVTSRTEATVYALKLGLFEMEEGTLAIEPAEPAAEPAPPDPPPDAAPADQTHLAPLPVSVGQGQEASSTVALPSTPARHSSRLQSVLLAGLLLVSIGLAATLAYVLLQQPAPADTANTVATAAPAAASAQPAASSRASNWQSRAAMNQPRNHFATAAYEGKIYVIGGSSETAATAIVERYDPNNDIWVTLNDKPTPASHIRAVTLRGRVYVPGGEDTAGSVLDSFEAYDPRSQQWQSLPPLPAPRSRYALASAEGLLYLFGGWDGDSSRNEVFIYDPDSQQWQTGEPMPTARQHAGAALVESRIYVVGGENADGPLQSNERYDPTQSEAGHWESAVPLPNAIANPAATEVVSTLLVFDPAAHLAWQYTPATDAWSKVAIPAATPLSGRVVPLRTSIFVFGPADDSQPGAVNEYETVYSTFLPNISRP